MAQLSKKTILSLLREHKSDLTSEIINDIIDGNEANRTRQIHLYSQYKGKVKIEEKTAVEGRPNNKLPNDFRGEIVDQKTGYSFGNPINYNVVTIGGEEETKEVKTLEKFLLELKRENNLASLDTQTAKYSSICGSSARLLYINDKKKIKIMHIDPWETIFIIDRSLDEVIYGIRYYKMSAVLDGRLDKEYYRVEWYDATTVKYFNETSKGKYMLDEKKPSQLHGFKIVPLIEFPNKEERLGDFEMVGALIDAYDEIESYNQDELQAFRNSYLVFQNMTIDEAFIKKMRELGGIELPENATVDWLIKELNENFSKMHLKMLENNIYRFAKAVNMSDENFSGAGQSGESRKWKMKALADDGILKEREFEKAVRNMFGVISTVWNLFDANFHKELLEIQFTNNIPADLLYHADVTQKLTGLVSDSTRLSLLPFVDDASLEMEKMANEASGNFNEDQAGAIPPPEEE